MAQSLAWIFTINNYTDDEIELLKSLDVRGMKAGLEIAPTTGTPHIQGAVCFHKKKRKGEACKALGGRASVRLMNGTWDDQDYCLKDDKVIRNDGEGPAQGKRSDLALVTEGLREGRGLQWVIREYPTTYVQWGRGLRDLVDGLLFGQQRQEVDCKALWIHGASGVGKSHMVFNWARGKDVFFYDGDAEWWDNYSGEEIVVLNEFSGELSYKTMLKIADKWPTQVRRRARAPAPFLATTIIVTSNETIESAYPKQASEPMGVSALARRFKVFEKKENDGITIEDLF